MSVTVKIEVDDQGQYSVGLDKTDVEATAGMQPGAMQPGGMPGMGAAPEATEDAGMQPAESVDAALEMARGLLTQGKPEAQGNIWDRVKRDKQMQSQPGGPMMGMKG